MIINIICCLKINMKLFCIVLKSVTKEERRVPSMKITSGH